MSILSGSKIVYVPLRPYVKNPASSADWSWDTVELEAAFTAKTKLIIINTPNNPLGKVYSKQELEKIAELCIKHNTICIADEVYEHITYDKPHFRIGWNKKTSKTHQAYSNNNCIYFVKLVCPACGKEP